MQRHLLRIVLATLAATATGVILGYVLLLRSLPQLDGIIAVDGTGAEITIARDGAGIPVITASSRTDLAFATGFVHGQDRFFQMDLTRRRAAGELAELFGDVAVPMDKRIRLHRFRSRAQQLVAGMEMSESGVMLAYVDGVNAGLASLAARPFEYLLLGAAPDAWLPEDTILVAYAMYLELNDERAARDLRRGRAIMVLPAEVFAWMYPQGTGWDAPLRGEPREHGTIPGPEVFATPALAGIHRASHPAPRMPGSNNWAVAGTLTGTGRSIVANDMHLGITAPNIFYRARLVVDGPERLDLNGITLPGVPVMVSGSNGRIAWGNTNSYGDWSDAVIVRPGPDEGTYMTPDGPQPFSIFRETIDVKGGGPEELIIRETIWGPLLDDIDYADAEIAVAWIAHSQQAINMRQIGLETAASVEEALAIANRMAMPPQNFVVGDADGNIGWTIAGAIPLRGDYDSTTPADWSESPGWRGWLPPDRYPRIVNPTSGRIWTANARVVDGEELRLIGDGGYDLGARARQIRDGLDASERFTPADMLRIHLDDRALFLERWRGLLLSVLDDAATEGHPDRREYRRLVQGWLPRAATESVGYRLVRAFRLEVRSRAFEMLMSDVRAVHGDEADLRISNQFEGPLWQMLTEQPAHLLAPDYESWRDFLLQAVDANLRYFDANYDDAIAQRSWGERNIAAIRHPLSRALPMLSGWLDMPPDPLHGDANMPRVQSPRFGASERFAVSPGDEANGYLHMPAGQSGHPLSEYYRAGHDDWVRGRATPFLPGVTRHTLTLTPRS